jgi:catechol 2,3-dioxygenase-like lactoylglutathione lyase family enzyme
MKILNNAHCAYRVSDLDEALKFYVDCLGLKMKFVITNEEAIPIFEKSDNPQIQEMVEFFKDNKEKPWIVYLEIAPNQYIELFTGFVGMKHCDTPNDQSGYLHLALEVDDIFKAKEELVACNVNLTSDISLGIDNTYQLWMKDPDGHAIELMQYTDKSFQLIGR